MENLLAKVSKLRRTVLFTWQTAAIDLSILEGKLSQRAARGLTDFLLSREEHVSDELFDSQESWNLADEAGPGLVHLDGRLRLMVLLKVQVGDGPSRGFVQRGIINAGDLLFGKVSLHRFLVKRGK